MTGNRWQSTGASWQMICSNRNVTFEWWKSTDDSWHVDIIGYSSFPTVRMRPTPKAKIHRVALLWLYVITSLVVNGLVSWTEYFQIYGILNFLLRSFQTRIMLLFAMCYNSIYSCYLYKFPEIQFWQVLYSLYPAKCLSTVWDFLRENIHTLKTEALII